MINPTNIATLNVLQNGHLNILASSSEKGEPYALTLNLAKWFATAVLAGGSECLKSGMTIFKEVLVWWLKKVERNQIIRVMAYYAEIRTLHEESTNMSMRTQSSALALGFIYPVF